MYVCKLMERVVSADLPTQYGNFTIYGYVNKENKEHHIALLLGDVTNADSVLVRVHSECLTGDALGSSKCDCGDQYDKAMRMIQKEGKGILVYLRQEGRGIGLINKLKAYALQDKGLDTVEANLALGFSPDHRDYTEGAEILVDLGVKKIRLMTNNPEKIAGLEKFGLEIIERVAIETEHKKHCSHYMQTKKDKMGHIFASF